MTSLEPAAHAAVRYRQGIPAIDLFIERGTERVPADGRYHVVQAGEVVGSYRGLKAAQRRYRQQLDAIGYVPAPRAELSTDEQLRREDLERDLLRSASFWAESYRHGGGGGKLRHR
jgi:hypothetical protein